MSVDAIQARIREQAERGVAIRICGSDSKAFYGQPLTELETLSSQTLDQIVQYEPSELVLQVQAGCRLSTIKRCLAEHGQMLAFDPPDFGGSTIGGAIASGIAGSRRPYMGAGRDFVLGVAILDGMGEQLTFGGQVMKNVAGYDVSRLMSGSLGCLGLMTELSLKVLPKPGVESSWVRTVKREAAQQTFVDLQGLPEVSASAWMNGQFYVRFSGSEQNVNTLARQFSGEPVSEAFWSELDSLQHFAAADDLWRVSTTPTAALSGSEDLIDWGGAQRWYVGKDKPGVPAGYATLVKSSDPDQPRFTELRKPIAELHRRLKDKFDPKRILNPNKMYQGL